MDPKPSHRWPAVRACARCCPCPIFKQIGKLSPDTGFGPCHVYYDVNHVLEKNNVRVPQFRLALDLPEGFCKKRRLQTGSPTPEAYQDSMQKTKPHSSPDTSGTVSHPEPRQTRTPKQQTENQMQETSKTENPSRMPNLQAKGNLPARKICIILSIVTVLV